MAALPPVANVLKLTQLWAVGPDTNAITRTFWKYTGGTPTTAELNAMAGSIFGSIDSTFAGLTSSSVSQGGVVLQDLASSSGAEGQDIGTVAGTRTGTPLPAGCAVLLNLTIARRYRGGKPRIYWPLGVAGDLSGPDSWSPAFQTAVNNAYSSFATAVLAASSGGISMVEQVNLGYYQGYTLGPAQPGGFRKKVPALVPGGTHVDQVLSGQINPKPGSQRRRNLHSK